MPDALIASSRWRTAPGDQCGFVVSLHGVRGEFPCLQRSGHLDADAFALQFAQPDPSPPGD